MLPLTLVFLLVGADEHGETCKTCYDGTCLELRDLGLPACAAPKKHVTTPAVPSACPPGKERSADTGNQCCWPGQAWNGRRCVGVPTSCPANQLVVDEECRLPACDAGKVRAQDAVHCCWPEQAWLQDKCIGKPSCPSGFVSEGDGCTSVDVVRAREEQARAAEAQKKREADEARVREENARKERDAQAERDRHAALDAERKKAEEARVAKARAENERRDNERKRRLADWETAKEEASSTRVPGYVVAAAGGVALGASVAFLVGGEIQNETIKTGGLATSSDITNAAGTGDTMNVGAVIAAAFGGVLGAVGGGLVLFNLDPPPPDLTDVADIAVADVGGPTP